MGKLELLIDGELKYTSDDASGVSINGDTGAVADLSVPADGKTVLNIRVKGNLVEVGEEPVTEELEVEEEEEENGQTEFDLS